jgi:hypothetical protein
MPSAAAPHLQVIYARFKYERIKKKFPKKISPKFYTAFSRRRQHEPLTNREIAAYLYSREMHQA